MQTTEFISLSKMEYVAQREMFKMFEVFKYFGKNYIITLKKRTVCVFLLKMQRDLAKSTSHTIKVLRVYLVKLTTK